MKTNHIGVLFADVKGYSLLSEDQLDIFHGPVMARVAARLKDYEYTYCNTWGDAIVVASENLRDLANLALEVRNFFRDYDWQSSKLPLLEARISVHRGRIGAGLDPLTNAPSIYGHTVVLAARVEPIVPPNQVWITERAAISVGETDDGSAKRFGLDLIGEVALPKGYGQQKLYLLRHAHEPEVKPETRDKIFEENALRASGAATSDRDNSTFTVVVGVVLHEGKVLLVKRKPGEDGLDWMFPSGSVLPLQTPRHRVWREVRQETGLSCRVVRKIGNGRRHPNTGAKCDYFLLSPIGDLKIFNADSLENEDVQWVSIDKALATVEDMYEDVADLLRAAAKSAGRT